MELVSRDTAQAVLSELVDSLGQLERVDTISEILINPQFDSVLESRFIESLKRLGGVGSIPKVKLVSDVVHGKSGYVLEVGGQRYKIEPQRNLGPEDGVTIASKPDFVIWPWSATSARKPIAVFCDGWAFHKDTLRQDAIKRSAIVSSGRFWVWSVTHNDVAGALKGELDTDLDSPLATLSRHAGAGAPASTPRAQEKAFTQHAVARLLQWLGAPVVEETDPMVKQFQRNALWLGFLMVPSNQAQKASCEALLGQWASRLPEPIRTASNGFAPSVSQTDTLCKFFGLWPLEVAKQGLEGAKDWSAPGVWVLEDGLGPKEDALHKSWRAWLHIYNTTQALPGTWLVTDSGLDAQDYVQLTTLASTSGESPSGNAALSGAWEEVLAQTLKPMQAGMALLAAAGADIPVMGLELADDNGKVVADCELGWPSIKLTVLRDDQEDLVESWTSQGWRVLLLNESMDMVDEANWHVALAQVLGLTMNEKE